MGPPHSTTVNGTQLPQKTTERSEAPLELTGYKKWLHENMMLLITLSGVLLGVVIGFSLRPLKLHADSIMLISYPGELFMRVLKLMILPLVISSLIAGSASLNARMNGKIALRTLVYFATTSFFNAILGIVLVLLIHPGDPGMHNTSDRSADNRAANLLDSLLDLGRNVFPDNLFQAAFQQAHTVYVPKPTIHQSFNETLNETLSIVNTDDSVTDEPGEIELIRVVQYRPGTNTLGIVFFCLVFGTLLGTIGNKGQVVIDFFSAVFEVVMKMVTCVMWLTPVGISSVIAGKILGVNDLNLVMEQLLWFIITVAIGVLFYQFVVMQFIYFVFLRRNPFKFYCGLIHAMLTAFATASTAAALPITFRCMNDKLRVDQRITRFVLPIGCNINMDGTALFISIASIFIAQMSGMTLGFGELVTVLLTSTAASMSSASVPSAALVLLLVVLSAIDAPVQDVTLLFAVDWFVDRIRTTNNMLGDCYAAAVVEELSKKELMALDAAVLYQELPVVTPNGHILLDGQTDLDRKCSLPDSVIVDMNNIVNSVNLHNGTTNNKLGSQLAQMLLDMFNNGLDRASLHLVGDSLGGQEVGLIGREVKRLSNGTQSIAKITALDPLLMGYENRTSVSTEDGDFVSVIHTNEGIYGLPVPRGHADFCPNGGIIQPGWMNQDEFMGKNFYSHRIAAIYWRESVEDEAGPQFWAFRAGSYGAYLAADPRQLNETAIEMGINTPSTARGQYYLRTNGEYPYARGFQDAVRNYGNNP